MRASDVYVNTRHASFQMADSFRTHRTAAQRNPIGGAADRAADEVTSLPGWEGRLPSKHYSGYLDVGLT